MSKGRYCVAVKVGDNQLIPQYYTLVDVAAQSPQHALLQILEQYEDDIPDVGEVEVFLDQTGWLFAYDETPQEVRLIWNQRLH